MNNDLVLLEYEQTSGCFHYNTLTDGKLDAPVCTQGYEPVTIMNRNVAHDRGFNDIICDAIRQRHPYPVVVEKVALWALNNPEKWMCHEQTKD